MNILGIHYGHNATVALMQEGEVEFACSEERFNRLKNSKGFPSLTLEYVYKNFVKPEEVDMAVIFQNDYLGYLDLKRTGFKSIKDFSLGGIDLSKPYSFRSHILSKFPMYFKIRSFVGSTLNKLREVRDKKSGESLDYFAKALNLPKEKIVFSEHHASHAYAACINLDHSKKTLVFTMDGEGDRVSSTVSTYQDYELKRKSQNPIPVSLGYFYSEITKLLGMIPNSHEFKVMGMAPYAKQDRAMDLYEKFKDLVVLNDNLEFVSVVPTNMLSYYLLEKLYLQRFDTIAAFAQIFLEKKTLEWIKRWIEKTGIHDLALSGGVFMNVKMNQRIAEMEEVHSLHIMPSAADESTAIGAAYYGYLEFCKKNNISPAPKEMKDLYLGNSYTDNEIEKFLRAKNYYDKYQIEKFEEEFGIEKKVAKLLSEKKVVARFNGRMEWGARALGNRSILADGSNRDIIKEINEMIKNRDFWMPFAASIMEEDQDRYLLNPKKIDAPYMNITFDTTRLAQKHLMAALHPYDLTSRPQIVSKQWSPSYHALISEFKNITDMGGILNTSFNLHGEPNVESPTDAMHTFEDSSLQYLAIGNYLISKRQ